MKRALCWIIGHHDWPLLGIHDIGPEVCKRCGLLAKEDSARRRRWASRWRRWWPLHYGRGRWRLSFTIGWQWLVYIKPMIVLREYGDWRPRVSVELYLPGGEVGVSLGGFWLGEEDPSRALFRLWANVTDPVPWIKKTTCRLRGHKPHEPLPSGYVYCIRCEEEIAS